MPALSKLKHVLQWQAMLTPDEMPHRVLIWDGKRAHSAEYSQAERQWVYGRGTKSFMARHQPLFWMPLPDGPAKAN